ncbi:ankyrin repeat-containing domain protein [Lentinula aff. lateritia]|uniref:Ankyrin repeat-containing domain protein n=1 Tax=Lentinula aff. lateritia TaxID=2804960 RepID=A0ACC1THF8_9AGAR|nr:ankyrin repeat-containing domain protein [Lentinula aff. lateritia]
MNQRSPIWYHYFDTRDNTESKTTYCGFLLSLVQQMGLSSESIHPALHALYKSKPFEQPTHLEIEKILETMIKNRNDITIAVDALDECQEADAVEVLNWLAEFSNQLQIVVTSRHQPGLAIENVHQVQLGDPKSGINEDIAKYIENKIHLEPRFNSAISGEIKDTLTKGAHGIFRWVDCQMMELQKCKKNRDIKQALKMLPATLKDTYDQALGRLVEADEKDVQHLLLWILYAFEPLTKSKANEICKVDLLEQKYDPGEMDIDVERNIPSTFVTVGQHDIIQLAHASVKEYLISYRQSKEINEHLAHDVMTQTTIIYLMQYDNPPLDGAGLIVYAVKYWLVHASKVEEFKVSGPAQDLIHHMLSDGNGCFTKWENMQQKIFMKNHYHKKFKKPTPLYYGALNGLYEGMKKLISVTSSDDVNLSCGEYGNALQVASYRGHESIVKLLLENNADANAQGGLYGNALQTASSQGYQNIVKLLLENHADVNAQGGKYEYALQAASYMDHKNIVQLLLKNNADINAQGGHYGNAFQAASYMGHEHIVQLLLENDADINATGGYYGNALQAASFKGHENIVQLLLKNNADINAQGGHYGNALQAASYMGHENIVRLLLENDADINATGGYYGNALQAASFKGHENIVQLLLKNNADINAQGGHHGNALQAASYMGHENIVQLLLENDADINAKGGYYGNALQAASFKGHENIVQLLLENNADVHTQGGFYGNALQAASFKGHENIVQLLLEDNADVHAQGGEYGNALHAASSQGHGNIVQMLRANGALD